MSLQINIYKNKNLLLLIEYFFAVPWLTLYYHYVLTSKHYSNLVELSKNVLESITYLQSQYAHIEEFINFVKSNFASDHRFPTKLIFKELKKKKIDGCLLNLYQIRYYQNA